MKTTIADGHEHQTNIFPYSICIKYRWNMEKNWYIERCGLFVKSFYKQATPFNIPCVKTTMV